MTRVVIFDVTQDDIDQGRPRDCYNCPVARSVVRTLGLGPAADEWTVGSWVIAGWLRDRQVVSVPAPIRVCRFIDEFDRGQPVEPFSFELELDVP
jgi:hypothetical protein